MIIVKKFFKALIAVFLAVALMGMTACDVFGGLFGGSKDPKVTLVLNGGTLSDNLTNYKEGTETVLPEPTKENYDFDGWYRAVDFSDGEAVTKISADETGNKIFYAKWTPKKFAVTLNLNGGTVAENLTGYTYGTGATLPMPEKAHFVFDGWYDSQNGGNKVTAVTSTDSGDKSFWARWNGINHKLTLELNGGTLSEDITTYQEGVETLLPVPEKDYYDFAGWHVKADLTDVAVDKITADKSGALTYYAEWTPKTYTVTLELNGGTLAQNLESYVYGTGAALPAPSKAEYNFIGWYANADFSGVEVTEISKTDSGNKIFYAKWISSTTINISAFGGYDEGAYLEFNKLSGVSDYKVSYKSESGAASFTQIDSELVREISANKIRADVVGLKAGNYTLKIEAGGRIVTQNVTVTAYDRSGYAHFDASAGNNVYADGVGGYKHDGTPKSGALIIYVSDATKNSVKATIEGKTYTGLIEILLAVPKSTKPVIIRVLDMVKAATWNSISYGKKPVTADYIIDNTPSIKGNTLEAKKYTMQELINLGFNTLNTDPANNGCSALDGLYDLGYMNYDNGEKKEFDSCWNNCPVGTGSTSGKFAQNVTLEGIGTSAGLFQWGITWKYAESIEVRNLTFDDYNEDACSFEGNTNSTTFDGFDSNRIWLHHCTFEEGKNYWDVCNEQDKGDGDGSTDFKKCAYITIAYNHYKETHKTGLIGGGGGHKTANVTFHHNYYQGCKARLPLGRQANMHMYNNYYEGTTDTCLSLRAGAYALVEYCYFKNAKNPIESKAETGAKIDNVSEGSLNGAAKVFNCKFDTIQPTSSTYVTIVTDRTIAVTNQNKFNQTFDTDASVFYYDAANKCSKVTDLITVLDDIPDAVKACAGVHKN